VVSIQGVIPLLRKERLKLTNYLPIQFYISTGKVLRI
jgi:hypothetical protein